MAEFHALRMAPLSFSWVLGRSFDILLFTSRHKFSIGLRSGDPLIKVQGFRCRMCLTGRDNKDRIKDLLLENGEVIEGVGQCRTEL